MFDRNYKFNLHGLFREQTAAMNSKDICDALEDMDIFSSDISGKWFISEKYVLYFSIQTLSLSLSIYLSNLYLSLLLVPSPLLEGQGACV